MSAEPELDKRARWKEISPLSLARSLSIANVSQSGEQKAKKTMSVASQEWTLNSPLVHGLAAPVRFALLTLLAALSILV